MRTISPKLKTLAVVVALAAVLAIGSTVAVQAQSDPCDTIQGTIEVADDAPNMTEMARITEDQAREAALTAFPGAAVSEIDLDEEEGYLVYEVDLALNDEEHEAYVDAGSGELLCTQRED